MNLSEAMRVGIGQTKPLREMLIKHGTKHKYACAFACISLGLGFESNSYFATNTRAFRECGVDPSTEYIQHPVIPGLEKDMETIILDLNDNWLWKRERIADWLEGLGY